NRYRRECREDEDIEEAMENVAVEDFHYTFKLSFIPAGLRALTSLLGIQEIALNPARRVMT
ncbi:hypothetical protein KKB28_04040, partial [bacterium]|nr:hypothetical protein [bacterium]